MLEVEDARQRIVELIQPTNGEWVLLSQASNRVAAQDLTAPISLPPFDNSAMDGYALRANDVVGASADSPKALRRVGAVPAGSTFAGAVIAGTCVQIFTGSPLPSGADAVVMQEDTRTNGDFVEVLDGVRPWENVRLVGQDIKAASIAVHRGSCLSAGRMALLGALGMERIFVARQPIIGLLSTGNELIEPGTHLAPGEIYESNRSALASLVTGAGGSVRVLPLVRDDLATTTSALSRAFEECDAVISTGGVSVGEHDLVKAGFEALGGTLAFWRVNVKPGKPFAFGQLREKFLFGLPGNPVSAFVTFLLLVRPAILKMQGAGELDLPSHPAVLAEEFSNRGDRRHFVRVYVDAKGNVRSAGLQASHALSSLAESNALLDVPPNTRWEAGQSVHVLRWAF
jgi:molybdopterin molybdotransferase